MFASRQNPKGSFRAILGTSDSGHDRPSCARCGTARSVSIFGLRLHESPKWSILEIETHEVCPRAGNRAGFFHARGFNCPVRKASVAGPLPNVQRSMARLRAGGGVRLAAGGPLSPQHGETHDLSTRTKRKSSRPAERRARQGRDLRRGAVRGQGREHHPRGHRCGQGGATRRRSAFASTGSRHAPGIGWFPSSFRRFTARRACSRRSRISRRPFPGGT
jgi:hypothetical protein